MFVFGDVWSNSLLIMPEQKDGFKAQTNYFSGFRFPGNDDWVRRRTKNHGGGGTWPWKNDQKRVKYGFGSGCPTVVFDETDVRRSRIVIVAASTSCIPNLPLQEIFDRLSDLEYTNTEIVIDENSCVKPEELLQQFDHVVHVCRTSLRITPIAFYFGLEPTHPDYYEHFNTVCRLAKVTRVVVVTVRAAVPGTPFNDAVDHLKELVRIGMNEGVVVGIATEIGRLTESPDTVGSLCKSVKGLGVTLDPSHYIFTHPKARDYDGIMDHVCHVRLRDTTKDQFQVRIGQGVLEFGRFVIQLSKVGYSRTLCVDLAQLPDVDPIAELRKMRLLLESLL